MGFDVGAFTDVLRAEGPEAARANLDAQLHVSDEIPYEELEQLTREIDASAPMDHDLPADAETDAP